MNGQKPILKLVAQFWYANADWQIDVAMTQVENFPASVSLQLH